MKIVDDVAKQYGVHCNYDVIFLKPVFPGSSTFCYTENNTYYFLSFESVDKSDKLPIKIDTTDLAEITYYALRNHMTSMSRTYISNLFGEIDRFSEAQRRIEDSFFCEMYAALGDKYLAYAIEAVKARNPNYLRESLMMRMETYPYVLTPRTGKTAFT